MKSVARTFDDMMKLAKSMPQKRIGVVFPDNSETFEAITAAGEAFHPLFTLVGEQKTIEAALGPDPGGKRYHVVDASNQLDALQKALKLVGNGSLEILMKGGIDTSTFMRGVLQPDSGVRMDRLLSDIFVLEYPQRPDNRLIMITDGGMTMAPDLQNKVELIRNAVEVAHALGNQNPKVAILSATEFVVPKLESTIDAAALSKMNERGQIKGCIVDGPLALDNAVSAEAAAEKRIESKVAGQAEILVAANIESANSLAKSTTYFANLRLAHVIVGGRIPVLIPSRADKSDAKMLSMALGIIMSSVHSNRPHD